MLVQAAGLEQALGKGVKLVPLAGVVEALRALKDANEIQLLRNAVDASNLETPEAAK